MLESFLCLFVSMSGFVCKHQGTLFQIKVNISGVWRLGRTLGAMFDILCYPLERDIFEYTGLNYS